MYVTKDPSGTGEKAIRALRQAIKIYDHAFRGNHPDAARAHTFLGNILDLLGRGEDAEAEYRSALEIREAVIGGLSLDTAESLGFLGQNLTQQNKIADAYVVQQRRLTILQKILDSNPGPPPPPPREVVNAMAMTHYNLAVLQEAQRRWSEMASHAVAAADLYASLQLVEDEQDARQLVLDAARLTGESASA